MTTANPIGKIFYQVGPLIVSASLQGAWPSTGRHGTAAVAESPTFSRQ